MTNIAVSKIKLSIFPMYFCFARTVWKKINFSACITKTGTAKKIFVFFSSAGSNLFLLKLKYTIYTNTYRNKKKHFFAFVVCLFRLINYRTWAMYACVCCTLYEHTLEKLHIQSSIQFDITKHKMIFTDFHKSFSLPYFTFFFKSHCRIFSDITPKFSSQLLLLVQ